MKSSLIRLFAVATILSACGKQEEVKAKIFERKELAGNRLKIRFRYTVDQKEYTDSATVANVVINADSIFVIIDPSNPGKSIPDISKEK